MDRKTILFADYFDSNHSDIYGGEAHGSGDGYGNGEPGPMTWGGQGQTLGSYTHATLLSEPGCGAGDGAGRGDGTDDCR